MIIWKLKKGADRRLRAGHPWVYSNELQESPKGIESGAAVELRDVQNEFLARGYGNAHSLIAFRVLGRNPEEVNPLSYDGVLKRLEIAKVFREKIGFTQSYRLCHGEADGLPGLIIDRYLLSTEQIVFVCQAHTAGAQNMLEHLPKVFESLNQEKDFGIVFRNDVSMRKLEGLEIVAGETIRPLPDTNFSDARILVSGFDKPVQFQVDFIKGQKTGFFLDQAHNIHLLNQWIKKFFTGKQIKVLDLCCYVGQWGAQIAAAHPNVHVTAVDASDEALDRAKKNIRGAGGECETLKVDVLKDLSMLAPQSFDVVICDPPALIKGRKDLPTGQHGYLKLNTNALKLLKPEGIYSTSSCSGLLQEEDFNQILAKAVRRAGTSIRWLEHGQQSFDHPILMEFPEGRYLKNWIGHSLNSF